MEVFEVIRQVQPLKLYISADGPRMDKFGEYDKCKEVIKIVSEIDWKCDVYTNFNKDNLGCRKAVSGGIDWFFSKVEEGIILEDDCLPDNTFFQFCEELLERYRYDQRIMMISGDNFQFGKKRTNYSYYFSRYAHIWGWASWRRAWEWYDVDMKLWNEIRAGGWLRDFLTEKKVVNFWTNLFNYVKDGKIDTWDHQVTFACWTHAALNIMPNVNLVTNIGFGHQDASRTAVKSRNANIPPQPLLFPMLHPPYIIRDKGADDNVERLHFSKIPIYIKTFNRFRKLIHDM